MKLLFVVLAALMAAAALGFVLWPLLRNKLSARPPLGLVVIIAFVLPVTALAMYVWVGTPAALQASTSAGTGAGTSTGSAPDFATAMTQLQAHLEQAPDDAQGWVLLARAYQSMQRNEEAASAYARALQLEPDSAELMVALAETRSMSRPDHQIDTDARALLRKALSLEPQHQRALWLLGISQYQAAEYAASIATWRQLLPLIDPATHAAVATAVQEQIASAEAAMRGARESPAGATSSEQPIAPTPASIEIEVTLDPALRDQLDADDTVFVFARAVDGPPMPLAVARLSVSDLPAKVQLDDSSAMSPQLTLSGFSQVMVFARVSPSGNAIAQTGDPEAAPVQVDLPSKRTISLVIDHPHK